MDMLVLAASSLNLEKRSILMERLDARFRTDLPRFRRFTDVDVERVIRLSMEGLAQ
jgi:hypothetical protein